MDSPVQSKRRQLTDLEEKLLSTLILPLTGAYLDVLDGVLQLWPHNIVQCIHTSIGGLDGFIKGQECSLQRCQLHEQLYGVHECLAARLYLLTTSTKTGQSQLTVFATRV